MQVVAPKLPDGPEPTPPAQIDYTPLNECKPCEDVELAARVSSHVPMFNEYS